MKYKRLKLSLIFLLTLGLTEIQAQESVNTTGADISGGGGTVSYSIGQIVYHTYSGESISVAEGVQQPYEISIISGVNEIGGISLSVSAYPNPTSDYLILEINNYELSSLTFALYDIGGRLLQNKKITDTQTRINMKYLTPATYLVRVLNDRKEVKTFKVIKR